MHFGSRNNESTRSGSYINRPARRGPLTLSPEAPNSEYRTFSLRASKSTTSTLDFYKVTNTRGSMNKLLVIAVLLALLAVRAESFRMPRQVEEDEGALSKITGTFRSYYDSAVNTASGYLDTIKGLKLEEKAKNIYSDTTTVVSTYAGIAHDQLYHIFYQK
ncbi:apolipoprotein C-II isoform 1-T1 [Spinachia spinachia]